MTFMQEIYQFNEIFREIEKSTKKECSLEWCHPTFILVQKLCAAGIDHII